MNCSEFMNLVDELANGGLPSGLSQDVILGHAAVCEHCALRLGIHRALMLGLKALANADCEHEAPSSIRSNLLAEFEDHALTAGLKALAQSDGVITAPASIRADLLTAFENKDEFKPATVVHFPQRSTWSKWVLAAAAAIILAVLFFAGRQWRQNVSLDPTLASTQKEGMAPAPDVSPSDAVNIPTPNANEGAKLTSKVSPVTARNYGRSQIARVRRDRNSRSAKNSLSSEVAAAEVKSQFVPLTYLNSATAMESGIVVRVEIAREKLASLGLPFELDRADDIIKAEIMLGDDGVARAIRLVQ